MQEISVVQRLQTEITELKIPLGDQRFRELLQIKLCELRIQQVGFNALLDEFREVINVMLLSIRLRHFSTKHFFTNSVHEQTRGNLTIRRIFFHERARSQNR